MKDEVDNFSLHPLLHPVTAFWLKASAATTQLNVEPAAKKVSLASSIQGSMKDEV